MADTKVSALTTATTLDGTELVPVVQGGASKKTTVADIRTIDVVKQVTSDLTNSTTSAAVITALTSPLTVGTWLVKVWLCYQSSATTTGIAFRLNYTGTQSRIVATWYTLTTGTTAVTGIADQATAGSGQTMEGLAQRANDISTGAMTGVDTANADQFAVLEGIVIATGTGNLEVKVTSEVNGSAVTVKPGSTIVLTKVP